MSCRQNPLKPADHELIRQKYAALVEEGMHPADAKERLAKQVSRSTITISQIVQGIGKRVGKRKAKGSTLNPDTLEQILESDRADTPLEPPKPVFPEFGYVNHTDLSHLNPDRDYTPKRPPAKTYIITGWEVRVRPDFAFIDCRIIFPTLISCHRN